MISVTAPLDRAFSWTKKILFSPFAIEKWFVMGFCAFLAGLAEGGIGGGGGGGGRGFNFPFSHESTHDWGACNQAYSWVMAHLPLVIALAGLVLILFVAIVTLFQWLGSRGQFMFLDGVVKDRAAVVEPWHRFRSLGNDLFLFRFLLGLCSLVVFAVLGLLGWFVARPDILAQRFGSSAMLALLVAGIPAVLVILALILVSLLLGDFVVPVMYQRNIRTGQALAVLWQEVIPGHGVQFILFYLMKLALGLCALTIIILGVCCTCCLAGVPYLSSVAFLPIFVFFRSYSLFFLEQFGEEWRLVGNPPAH